jgi:hypothetical protein
MSLFESFSLVADEIRHGKVEDQTFSNHLNILESDCLQTEKQIQEWADPEFEEELIRLKSSFSQLKDGISELKSYFQNRREEKIEKGLALLESAFGEISSGINNFFLQKAAKSPSKDGPLNILIHAAPGLEQGVGEAFFGNMLPLFERHFKGIRRNFRHILQICEMNSHLQEAEESTLPDIQTASHALQQIQESFKRKSYAEIQENLKILVKFIEQYNEFCKKILDVIAKKEEKICPRCGTHNPGETKTCVYCSFVFPFQDDRPTFAANLDVKEGEAPLGEPILSRNLAKIYRDLGKIHNMAEDYQDGEVSKQDLTAAIEQAKEKTVNILNRLSSEKEKLGTPSSKNEENIKLIETEQEGFQLILEGLHTTQTWIESKKTEDYWNGFKQGFSGMVRLQETKSLQHS